jgi:2-methylcitrate dehydratase PrpD
MPQASARRAEKQLLVTQGLAERACELRLDDVPDHVKQIARLALLDWYAVTWAGAKEPSVSIVRAEIEAQGGNPQARLIGSSNRTSTLGAAVVNGTAGHVLDYDDVQNILPGHATAPVAPAVLALAESIDASGEALLLAFIAGFETTCRVGALTSPGLFRRGYQGTTPAGAIGAAAACAKLLNLDVAAMSGALGLAATQASGLQAVFGSMAKCFNVGRAAQSGLLAAQLVARGFECTQNVLEAERGFAAVFADGGDGAAALGVPPGGWHLCRNLFKNYASCFMTHSPLEALAQLRAATPFTAAEVDRLVLRVEPHFHKVVLTPPPATGLEVKFNVQHCLALSLGGFDTGAITTFSDELAVRPDLQALAAKCVVELDPDMVFTAAEVEVQLKNGLCLVKCVDTGEPEPDVALSTQRTAAKARALLTGISDAQKNATVERFMKIETLHLAGDLHTEAV